MMSELKSKCCEVKYIYWLKVYREEHPEEWDYEMVSYCPKCHKPCKAEETPSK